MALSTSMGFALGLALLLAVPPSLAQYDRWDTWGYKKTPLATSKWLPTSATFYGNKGETPRSTGSCGYPWAYWRTINEVAVPDPRYQDTLTRGFAPFLGAACGQCYDIFCYPKPRYNNQVFCKNSKPLRIVITNYDTPRGGDPPPFGWPHNHFDFHANGYDKFAELSSGVVNIMFRRVPCNLKARAKYVRKGHDYYHDIVIFDVPGAGNILEVHVRVAGETYWRKLDHGWGAHWYIGGMKIDFNNPNTIVRGRVAEARSKFVYPMRVDWT